MISNAIIKELSPITDEEQRLLDSKGSIDKSLYSADGGSVINAKKLLQKGNIITIRPHTRFVHFPAHYHDYVEAIYMCQGSTVHIINGQTITLHQGELLFLGMNAKHEILEANEKDIAVNFIILPEFFDQPLKLMGETDSPLKVFLTDCLAGKHSGDTCYIHFKCAHLEPVQNLIENLLFTIKSDLNNKQSINKTTMGLIFLHLMNNTAHLDFGNDQSSVVMQVISYIENNYKSGSLTEIAAQLNLDIAQLSREIKSKTGQTYTQLTQQKRLDQAAYLLRNTKLSVFDVAQAVGYNNTTYFHKMFLEQFGLSPHKYRACK